MGRLKSFSVPFFKKEQNPRQGTKPPSPFPSALENQKKHLIIETGAAGSAVPGEVRLPTGSMSAAQLDALLNTIPLELTFVDDANINRYWNDDGEKKLFKRPESALGREVWSCHPPKVQEMVRQVIGALRSGEQDSVDVWMEKDGEPVLVRYMAVRNREGAYLGTLEAVQRMGFARDHFRS